MKNMKYEEYQYIWIGLFCNDLACPHLCLFVDAVLCWKSSINSKCFIQSFTLIKKFYQNFDMKFFLSNHFW